MFVITDFHCFIYYMYVLVVKSKQLVSFHLLNWSPFKLSSKADAKLKSNPFCKSAQSGTPSHTLLRGKNARKNILAKGERGVRMFWEFLREGGQFIFYSYIQIKYKHLIKYFLLILNLDHLVGLIGRWEW